MEKKAMKPMTQARTELLVNGGMFFFVIFLNTQSSENSIEFLVSVLERGERKWEKRERKEEKHEGRPGSVCFHSGDSTCRVDSLQPASQILPMSRADCPESRFELLQKDSHRVAKISYKLVESEKPISNDEFWGWFWAHILFALPSIPSQFGPFGLQPGVPFSTLDFTNQLKKIRSPPLWASSHQAKSIKFLLKKTGHLTYPYPNSTETRSLHKASCPENPNLQFVSNLTGSSMLEISALLTTVPILVLLRHSISSKALTDADTRQTSSKKKDSAMVACKSLKAYLATLAMDFVFFVLPTLLLFTVLAEWTYSWAILLSLLLFISVAVKRSRCLPYSDGPNSFRTSISSYRVAMMIVTCLCILAVDFRIFPREFAKTETYGTSLMDLGVGSFVLVNSIVSRQARNVSSSMNWCKATLKSTTPLLLLGFGRLISTLSVDYQVHVGEYGVHWNFFFTLAGVSILTSIVNVPPKYSGILGSVILVGYQSWLSNGLNVYLLSNERGMHIISRNKEGIFSIFGYWGMYLIGVQVGYYLFFGNCSSAVLRSNNGTRIRVWLLSIMFWFLTLILDSYVERISRRMCNLAYVTWVLAQNLQLLAVLMLSDYVPGSKISALERAFDRNLLASFLLANVLTGLVNLSVDTLFASSVSALLILIFYALTLSVVIGIIEFYGVRLKFW
ncbi:uncharacterized protein At4g17910-like [Durio zibethinus]|uniref:Uncharacterized protein At4g17910-like n=1 Tax=Durio zibethinus TaxID=66656 RepID=A0A6P5Y4A9_DURZI|nr:uncharacterized protein At4g17910-like [Durio zibethinus]